MQPIPVTHLDVRNLPMIGSDPPLDSYDALLAPNAIHVRLSARCQYECFFCERESWKNGDKDEEQDMTAETWGMIRDKYLPHVNGCEVCGLGEPTLHPLFPQVCQDIIKAGKTLYFPTNGVSLGSKKILDAIGNTPRVSVSLDAWDAESYKAIRGGDWNKVINAVKKFHAAKPDAFLHSQYTAGTYNIDGLPKFMRAAADMGVREVILRFVQAHTVAREDVSLRFAKDRTEAAITEASRIASEAGIWFTAERRPYAPEAENTAGDDSEAARLARYLSFVPMDAPTCPGTSTIPMTTIYSFSGSSLTSVSTIGGVMSTKSAPEIVRSVTVPRRTWAAQLAQKKEMPVEFTNSTVIAWDDGRLTTCFAAHEVGNVKDGTWDSLLRNPRYQAFLHNRTGDVNDEVFCFGCPRNF